MARAKRTERATARRRYRATLDPAELEAEDAAVEGSAERTGSAGRPNAGVGRMGIRAALRAAYHPLRVRDDLAVLPSLVLNKALWLPVLVTALSSRRNSSRMRAAS